MNFNIIKTQFKGTNGETTPSSHTTSHSNGLREELLTRADELQGRAKAAIAKLQLEGREHMAIVLSELAWSVKMVANELRNSNPSPVRLVVLEQELIDLEYRINKEVNNLGK